ncbi:MAG: prolipoprotein diacylglyceryl transferase [Chloroflexota bacterium]|nr:prolipoprotein diacylglyceryl transferase [Chloroflexota bacterium]
MFLLIDIPWNPNIFSVFGLLITWHGFFTAVGLLCGVWLGVRLADLFGYDPDQAYNLALIGIPGGVIGARALYVVENISKMDSIWEWFAITEGGISIWGAVLGGVLFPITYGLVRKIALRVVLDAAAFGMILGMAIGRLGDLVNGEHCAKLTNLPWGVMYSNPESPGLRCAIIHHGTFDVAVHPATTYEIFGNLLILACLFLAVWQIKFWRWPGVTFLLYLDSYALLRFGLTYFRVDSSETFLFDLRVPQLVSILVLAISLPVLVYFIKFQPLVVNRPGRFLEKIDRV